jgi:hypothetical protein
VFAMSEACALKQQIIKNNGSIFFNIFIFSVDLSILSDKFIDLLLIDKFNAGVMPINAKFERVVFEGAVLK